MKLEKIKTILKLLSVPLTLLIIYFIVLLIWKFAGLPPQDQMITIVQNFFDTYGPIFVFISALIEGFLLLGSYFPGGFVIFLGVITSVGDIPRAILFVSLTSLAFFISYSLNYWLGKYGFYKIFAKMGIQKSIDNSKKKLHKHSFNAIFLSYWEPNLSSITATAAGIIHLPLRKFLLYSAIGIIFWNTFWGILVYNLGEKALELMGLGWVLTIVGVWILIILIKYWFFERRKS